MKILILFVSLILLNSQVFSKMTSEERQELLNKLTRKVSLENLGDFKNIENDFISNSFKDTIDYDPAQIENIMNYYGFPENYNFLEETNATIHVKDQQNCGCCWSHAATSALAYRYHLKGIEVNLSPQDGLSCYIKDCDYGNYLIDPQLNLIKNGTLTEECFPFSAGDGNVEECPTSCKDQSEFKRYFAQNAYFTQDYYSKDTFYQIVPLIMDELIENGPVVSAISVYEDFTKWHQDKEKCHNDVYSYDEKSSYLGGHAVVIVGYGFLNDKFYWLIQNSWGENTCDQGFVKVEFGQIGVESVAFSEPYSRTEGTIPVEIPVKLESLDEYCYIKASTTSDYKNWKNTLDLSFKNDKKGNNFNFQCGTNSFLEEGTKINCYTEINNYFTYRGIYKFQEGQSLGTENTFNLDKLSGKSFTFYGYDDIGQIIPYDASKYYYISEEGSQILLGYESETIDEGLPPIYANVLSQKPLSDCQKLKYNGSEYEYFVYCNIKKDEVAYFENLNKQSDNPMFYLFLCGGAFTTETIAYQLDKTKYPIFRIKSLVIPEKKTISSQDKLIINVNVEGSVTNFQKESQFIIFSNLEKGNENTTLWIVCKTGIPSEAGINYNLTCEINLEKGKTESYDNIYLLPYYIPYYTNYPYEVIIKKEIKGKNNYDPEPDPEPKPEPEPEPDPKSSSRFYQVPLGFILLILLL